MLRRRLTWRRAQGALTLLLLISGSEGACAAPAVQAPPHPEPVGQVELLSADADVWASRIALRGRLRGARAPTACSFHVGESARVAATLEAFEFAGVVPLAPGVNTVIASCTSQGRNLRSSPVHYRVRQAELAGTSELPQEGEQPGWAANAVVYGVIPPLYGSPPLVALTQALDSLAELGVTALWLSPIFVTPPGNFGYAVVDPFAVRSDYGTHADLLALVRAAHERKLRVLLDFVPNHTSDQHPYFMQAQALGSRSHYFGFYARDGAGQPTHYFDWTDLPNLDFDNGEVEQYTLAAAAHWLRHADVDGYRVDAAWGIRQRDAAFWPRFSQEMRRVKPALFLLAEASARDPYYVTQGFDAAYDWTDALGQHAWQDVFSSERGIPERLHAAVSSAESGVARVFRFLNNNDTGERFIARHGEPLTRVATAALLTLPGIPCLYAFDEVGAVYLPYGELRPITQTNSGLRDFHRRLIMLRRDFAALRGSGFAPLHVGGDDDAYVYLRSDAASGAHALVALNFGARPTRVRVQVPPELGKTRWRDALGQHKAVRAGRELQLDLLPFDAKVLLP